MKYSIKRVLGLYALTVAAHAAPKTLQDVLGRPVGLERDHARTALLEEISGEAARAQAINHEYKGEIDQIQSRLKLSKAPAPRVYVEFGHKGPAEYSFTYGKNRREPVLASAGGDNNAAPMWNGGAR